LERESRIIATAFALTAFSVSIVCGLASGNAPLSILIHALIVMVVCQIIGLVAGEVLAYAARSHVDSRGVKTLNDAGDRAKAEAIPTSDRVGASGGGGKPA
jgi:hypothetical protein